MFREGRPDHGMDHLVVVDDKDAPPGHGPL